MKCVKKFKRYIVESYIMQFLNTNIFSNVRGLVNLKLKLK